MAPTQALPLRIPFPEEQYSRIARTPLNVLICVLSILSLLLVVTCSTWFLVKFIRHRYGMCKIVRTVYVYPAKWCGGARRKDKLLKARENERKRQQKEKRRPPLLNFGASNFAQEHHGLMLNTPTSSISSPSLSPRHSSSGSSRLSSSSSSPSSLSHKLPRDIIREKSSPSRLGFIQIEHIVDGSRPASVVTTWCESPVVEGYFPIMPGEHEDGYGSTCFQEKHVVGTTVSMEMQAVEEQEGVEYKSEEVRMSAYDSDDSWDFKCRGDVEGDPSEFNEDGFYKIPEDIRYAEPESDVRHVDAVDLQRVTPSVPTILVHSPTFPPSPLLPVANLSEVVQHTDSLLPVPRRNKRGRGAEAAGTNGEVANERSAPTVNDNGDSAEEIEDDYSSPFEFDYIYNTTSPSLPRIRSKLSVETNSAKSLAPNGLSTSCAIVEEVQSASPTLTQYSTQSGSQLSSTSATVFGKTGSFAEETSGKYCTRASNAGSGTFIKRAWSSTRESLTFSGLSLKGKAKCFRNSSPSDLDTNLEANTDEELPSGANEALGSSPMDSCKSTKAISAPIFVFSTATTCDRDDDQLSQNRSWGYDLEAGLTKEEPSSMSTSLLSGKKRFSFPGLGNKRKNEIEPTQNRRNDVDLEARMVGYKNSDWDALLDEHAALVESGKGSSSIASSRILSSARNAFSNLTNVPMKLTRSMSDKVKTKVRGNG